MSENMFLCAKKASLLIFHIIISQSARTRTKLAGPFDGIPSKIGGNACRVNGITMERGYEQLCSNVPKLVTTWGGPFP